MAFFLRLKQIMEESVQSQREWLRKAEMVGYRALAVKGLNQSIEALERYLCG
jgi:hypothetical protein